MTIRNLQYIFNPKTIAFFGASERAGSVGKVVFENALKAGFPGELWPVNPKHDEVMGQKCYRSVADLPAAPDLAIIGTPAQTVPPLISELGERGTRAAVVLSAGITRENGLHQALLDAAKPYLFRVIGPNTLGMLAPPLGIDASFAHIPAKPGSLALLSQSGAIATTLIDWAASRDIGFSRIISLGNMADVDVGDCLDMLATDPGTSAILMYLESVTNPRKFISAARAAARIKPVIAIKSGRFAAAAAAAATHTGALSGADNIVEAALKRAGVLRVHDLDDLFFAAETVARFEALDRARIGIVTNGGGAGVLAVDQLMEEGSEMATLDEKTITGLDDVLPDAWSRANPVDIIGDAPPERYVAAVRDVAADENVDALMVMNCPTALAESKPAADALADMVKDGTINGKPVLACWLGEETAHPAWEVLRHAGIASFETPARVARAVTFLNRWTVAQRALMRVPENQSADTPRDPGTVRKILKSVADTGRTMLTEPEAKSVFKAYGIPVPEIVVAKTPDEAFEVATDLMQRSQRLVIKILSEDISHKSDVGGVVLDIESPEAARSAAEAIAKRVAEHKPGAVIEGYAIQPMVRRPKAHELIIGMSRDPVFGPAILFGAGGTTVELVADTAIGLPPLDDVLGRDLINSTRIGKLLKGFRDIPPADERSILNAINAISQLVIDFPGIEGVDINPLLADDKGIIALDARIQIDLDKIDIPGPSPDLVIRPYPIHWHKQITLPNGRPARLRPIRPDDVDLSPEFLAKTGDAGIETRLLAAHADRAEEALKRLTQLDYDREMAFVALIWEDDRDILAAIANYSADPDHETAQFGIQVRADLQGQGLGWAVFEHMISFARTDGIKRMVGTVSRDNSRMLTLSQEFGFEVTEPESPDGPYQVTLTFPDGDD